MTALYLLLDYEQVEVHHRDQTGRTAADCLEGHYYHEGEDSPVDEDEEEQETLRRLMEKCRKKAPK